MIDIHKRDSCKLILGTSNIETDIHKIFKLDAPDASRPIFIVINHDELLFARWTQPYDPE